MPTRSPRAGVALLALVLAAPTARAQITFNFINGNGVSAQMMAGFAEAGAIWSSKISTPVTLNVTCKTGALAAGQIGSTSAFYDPYTYSQVRTALVATRTSADDFSSTGSLQAGPAISMLINRTANNPNGVVSATPYFDTGLGGPGQAGPENNTTIRVTSANAKALGIYPGNAGDNDGTITFSNTQAFDFARGNGISAGQVDFVGVAVHELGHLMGFLSGVDVLDRNSTAPGLNDNQLLFVSPMNLFRFSARSIGTGGGAGVIDFTADTQRKYFSLDGGTTALADFSTGTINGDGFESHHWKNSATPIGIMDPTAANGELLAVTDYDLRALDAIGYTLTPVPEPGAVLLVCVGGVLLSRTVKRRRKSSHQT